MFKRIRPISLILLAGAFSFPKSAWAEPTIVGESLNISQQSGKCSGIVEDDFGPVAGASVIVKGTTNGIMTDMDGNFTLEGVKKGDIILRIEASYRTLLCGERLSLNILQRMSGIATATSHYMKELAGTHTQLLDTRKTAPGLRVLDKMAVHHGGGSNHRMGLYDMIMLKDNHIKIAGGIPNAVKAVKQNLPLSIKVEVETTTLEEVQQAIDAGADIIMLDNMSNETMAEAVRLIAGRAKTEASGNISIPRLQGVAATGVDYISVGALTHSVTALDISMNIKMN